MCDGAGQQPEAEQQRQPGEQRWEYLVEMYRAMTEELRMRWRHDYKLLFAYIIFWGAAIAWVTDAGLAARAKYAMSGFSFVVAFFYIFYSWKRGQARDGTRLIVVNLQDAMGLFEPWQGTRLPVLPAECRNYHRVGAWWFISIVILALMAVGGFNFVLYSCGKVTSPGQAP